MTLTKPGVKGLVCLGFVGGDGGFVCVVNLEPVTTIQRPGTGMRHQSPGLFLHFLFVFFFYDPPSCTWSLFISRRGRSTAAHIHIHMYKEKIRPNSASFLSAEPERHDEGRQKRTSERTPLVVSAAEG